MIDISGVNAKLVEQDEVLRAQFAEIARRVEADPATHALVEVLSEGLAALHERQGNLITLMLQTTA